MRMFAPDAAFHRRLRVDETDDPEALRRLKELEAVDRMRERFTLAESLSALGLGRSPCCERKRRLQEEGVRGLVPRSSRPARHAGRQWTMGDAEQVSGVRSALLRWTCVLGRPFGRRLCASTLREWPRVGPAVATKNDSRLYSTPMYVCLCLAVKESEVRRAIAAGADDVEALGEKLGIGTGCGCCREYAQALLEEHGRWPSTAAALPQAG